MTKPVSEQPHIRCIRTPQGLQGASWYDQSRIERYAIGTEVEVTARQKRSTRAHRFYFVCLGNVLPNLPEGCKFPRVDDLHDAIKMELGYREPFLLLDGTVQFRPGSIAFDKMEEPEFRTFLNQALTLIQTELIPGLDITALKRKSAADMGDTLKDVA